MKFRYRLLVGFLVMMLLPVILIASLGLIIYNYQPNSFGTAYNALLRQEDMSAATAVSICNAARNDVLKCIDENPTWFTDSDITNLRKYNDQLMYTRNCFLVVYKGTTEVFRGDFYSFQTFSEGWKADDNSSVQYYAPDNVFYSVVNVTAESQKQFGKILVVTHAEGEKPPFRVFVIFFAACAVLILFLTALLITMGISRSIIRPIREVQKASRKVRDGDLDYELIIKDKEFAPLCDDFNQMRLRLKETDRIKAESDAENQELISNISHDLKTPLTAIKGYVEGLLDNIADTPERRERYLTTIYNKTNDMQRLIDELTFYSRIDTNRIPYNFVPLPIADFFRDCADETELDLTSRGMKMEFACEVEDYVLVKADPEQMRRVLNNIIGNSVKYMDKPEGVVGIHLWRDETKVYAEIMDNGPGISEDALPYIFDRFYRADAARTQNQAGSGIGLSIVQKVVEDHGGTVYATSKLGEGTKITIELVIYNEDEDREDEEDIDR